MGICQELREGLHELTTPADHQEVWQALVLSQSAVQELAQVEKALWRDILIHNTISMRGVAGGDGELGCLCGKAGTSHLCDGSAHSSGCVVNGSNAF